MYVLIKGIKPFATANDKEKFAQAIKEEEVLDNVKLQPFILPDWGEVLTVKYIGEMNGDRIVGSIEVSKVINYE